MGFFNFDKPGPGVDPNAPKKKGIFLYFELLLRRFGQMLKINMLYFIVSLPMVAICLFGGMYFVNLLSNIFTVSDPVFKTQASLLLAFLFLVFIGSGPASAALAYFYRTILRERHILVFSDFFDNFKKNFAQGLTVGIINTLLIFITSFCTFFYLWQYSMTNQLIWFAAMLVVGMFCLVLIMSGFYIYQLMITFESTILELYKNAILLALAKVPQNIGLILIITVISYLLFFVLHPVALLLLAFFGLIAVFRFALDLYSARVIEKIILKK